MVARPAVADADRRRRAAEGRACGRYRAAAHGVGDQDQPAQDHARLRQPVVRARQGLVPRLHPIAPVRRGVLARRRPARGGRAASRGRDPPAGQFPPRLVGHVRQQGRDGELSVGLWIPDHSDARGLLSGARDHGRACGARRRRAAPRARRAGQLSAVRQADRRPAEPRLDRPQALFAAVTLPGDDRRPGDRARCVRRRHRAQLCGRIPAAEVRLAARDDPRAMRRPAADDPHGDAQPRRRAKSVPRVLEGSGGRQHRRQLLACRQPAGADRPRDRHRATRDLGRRPVAGASYRASGHQNAHDRIPDAALGRDGRDGDRGGAADAARSADRLGRGGARQRTGHRRGE